MTRPYNHYEQLIRLTHDNKDYHFNQRGNICHYKTLMATETEHVSRHEVRITTTAEHVKWTREMTAEYNC